MSLKKILSIVAMTAAFGMSHSVQDCSISAHEEANLLALPYQEFDQNLNSRGWRDSGNRGCFALAAGILDRYNTLHRDSMQDWQIWVVTWHAGQMYAFDGNYKLAKERFENSCNPHEPANTPLLWNDYVSATLAFLEKDVEKLRLHRDRIANGPSWNEVKGNLDVVNGLLKCIDKPYSVAYSDPSCQK